MRGFLRKWLVAPIKRQLAQGISPNRLSWAATLGLVVGVIPIMGSTSALCLFFGWLFKLNQPILHLFKTVAYPLQILLLLVFIRLGQQMNGKELLSLSVPELSKQFQADWVKFLTDFGIALLYGIQAWSIFCLVATPLLYFAFLGIFKLTARRIQRRRAIMKGA